MGRDIPVKRLGEETLKGVINEDRGVSVTAAAIVRKECFAPLCRMLVVVRPECLHATCSES